MPLPTFFNLTEEKRQKFLDCAIDEFASHDYNTASISNIVRRLGIAKGSLYQYFEDKEDLHHYLLDLASEKKTELMTGFSPQNTGASVLETLKGLFSVMVTFEIRYPKLAEIGSRAIRSGKPLPGDIVDKARQATQEYLRDLVESGKKTGQIRAEVDSNLAAFYFSSALAAMGEYIKSRSYYGFSEGEAEENRFKQARLEKAFDQIIDIFQYGISNPWNMGGA